MNCVGPGPDAAFNTIGGNDRLFFQPGSNLPAGNTAGGADDDLAVVYGGTINSLRGDTSNSNAAAGDDVITVYGGHFLDEVQGNHLTDLIVLFGGTLDSTAETGDGVGDRIYVDGASVAGVEINNGGRQPYHLPTFGQHR